MLCCHMKFERVFSPLPPGYSSAAFQSSRPQPLGPLRVPGLQPKVSPEFLRSVDYRGLMTPLTPFRINTSKKSRHFCIAFILNDFKSTRINTSAISRFNPSRINTSKKQGGTPRILSDSLPRGVLEAAGVPAQRAIPFRKCARLAVVPPNALPSASNITWASARTAPRKPSPFP
jgi:hypothetical protein